MTEQFEPKSLKLQLLSLSMRGRKKQAHVLDWMGAHISR